MKTFAFRAILATSLLVFPLVIFAQGIGSVSIYPANPTPEDSVKVIAGVLLPSGSCWLENHYSNIYQDTLIDVWGTFNSGMLTVICYDTDTFSLGRLEAGTYYCTYYMKYVGLPLFLDSASQSFTVSPVSAVNNIKQESKGFSVGIDPGSDQIRINYHLPVGEAPLIMCIYSTDGRLVQQLSPGSNDTGENTITTLGIHGLYLFSLETSSNRRFTQKCLVL